jgi:hypothetical protein
VRAAASAAAAHGFASAIGRTAPLPTQLDDDVVQEVFDSVPGFRRSVGRYWSQDIGLSMMLVLDALSPDWRSQVLRDDPPSIYALLAEAAGSP